MNDINNKHVVFLEDNPRGIGPVIKILTQVGAKEHVTKRFKSFTRELRKLKENNQKIKLFIIDDNLYQEHNLEDVGLPQVDAEDGLIAGSKLVEAIRNNKKGLKEEIKHYSDVPIILYSVHSPEDIKGRIGNLNNVEYFEKLAGNKELDAVLNSAKKYLK